MLLAPSLVERWPKLSWVASLQRGSDRIEVRHGPAVETARDWLVEAVWAGDFREGAFDRSDLLAGTGVRIRGDHVVFVSSGTAVDRLWHCRQGDRWLVSNSLPALLAGADLELADDHDRFPQHIETIDEGKGGLSTYVRQFPTSGEPVNVLYFHNLVFDGQDLTEVPKPDTAPEFDSYDSYFGFLTDTAKAMGANLRCEARTHQVVPVTTISSGYDSCAVAVIARYAGCRQAVTISNSTSLWRGSDSGEGVAEHLGLRCRSYRHTPRAYRHEEAIWAAIGRSKGMNLTIFDYGEPLTLLFTGNYGDKIWDLSYGDVREPTGDLSGLCVCELRLMEGFFHCMPAWWGVRHSRDIQAINRSAEMEPWRMHNGYDRPIARRMIEEASVPRGAFARRKKNTSSDSPFWWPYSRSSQASFRRYMRDRGRPAPGPLVVGLIRRAALLENLLHKNVLRKLGLRRRWRPWQEIRSGSLLFQWANDELKRLYLEA